jgi:precorrin-3B C17-methyltransferase
MSPRCRRAIEDSDLIVGYTTYIDLIRSVIGPREVYLSGMRREKDRAAYALQKALAGRRVTLVSGGDPGVYGLAGLVLELASPEDLAFLHIEIIPGITAATAAAATLGAPLVHDFAVISLSDLLTDRGLIERRLDLAARGDFVTVLYNPRSTRRRELFDKLPEIFLPHRDEKTPVGIVRDAGRDTQTVILTTLGDLPKKAEKVQMGSTVMVGNSSTYVKEWAMITPRGYETG